MRFDFVCVRVKLVIDKHSLCMLDHSNLSTHGVKEMLVCCGDYTDMVQHLRKCHPVLDQGFELLTKLLIAFLNQSFFLLAIFLAGRLMGM